MITSEPQLPFVPDELIVEILSWLPVKSLVQFRCVSKYWKSLISNPNFVKLHFQRSARNPKLLLYRCQEDEYRSVVPFYVCSLLENPSSSTIAEDDCYRLNHNIGHCVVGSCNGLVCLFKLIRRSKYKYIHCRFSLCNPATKLTSKHLTCLGFTRIAGFGFGYDNLSDTYKVVALCLDTAAVEESHKIQVKICSLGDNCWRNIPSFPVAPSRGYYSYGGVYLNATLNWLAFSDDYKWNETAGWVIVSLDLTMETYKLLLLPNCLDETSPVEPTIGVLMDCLCFSHDYERNYFIVWQMKEFGIENSWAQFMKISYQDLQYDYFEFPFPFPLLPLSMSKNGDMIIATIGKAILYRRRYNRVEQVELPKSIRWYHTKDYVESLVSPCCN